MNFNQQVPISCIWRLVVMWNTYTILMKKSCEIPGGSTYKTQAKLKLASLWIPHILGYYPLLLMKYDLINCSGHGNVSPQVGGFRVFIFQLHLGKEWELADIERLWFNSGITPEKEVREIQGGEGKVYGRGTWDFANSVSQIFPGSSYEQVVILRSSPLRTAEKRCYENIVKNK